ncbi:aspartate aminotransferase family protein [Liquorilactobacillus sicerae]|uniref:aspartate aminotransferase family protein n=1 Tax=Liquorilactobacillus sicerae TaxID=1416943 RepID=UPI0024817CB6|nr:aspartate aminotransferase family protein [Liquorilactobacillus sicerae]
MLSEELPRIISTKLPGKKAAEIIAKRKQYVPNSVSCVYPVVIDKAQGAIIQDPDGNRFLDWVGGVGVLNVGHAHPKVVAAIKKQSEKYLHGMFNIVTHSGYVDLAEKLATLAPVKKAESGAAKVFFANSGAEVNENAVKIAKAYTKRSNIIVFSGAFHGRTLLTMTMTSKKAYAKDAGPLANGVFRADFPYYYRLPKGIAQEDALDYYLARIKKVFEECASADQIAAMVVEPVQGEGGFIPAPLEWVKAVRKICDENGILLIADEVQSGFGRTGRLFASEYWKEAGVAPDILTTAKSIADGLPLGAVIASKEIMDSVPSGVIGGTFGGNAVACAAGLQVLEIIKEENLIEKSQKMGQRCLATFKEWQTKYPVIGDVRGLGSMVGIEFIKDQQTKAPATDFVKQLIQVCVHKGLILENAGVYGNVVRFLAPLVTTDEQLTVGFSILEESIQELSSKPAVLN